MKQKKIQNSQQILRRRHGKVPNLLVLLLILTVRVSFFVCLGLSKRIREPQLTSVGDGLDSLEGGISGV